MIEVKNVIKRQNKTWKKQRQRKKRTRTLEIYATASKDGVWEIIYDITDEQVVNIPATIQDQAWSTDDSRNSPQPLLVASSRVRAKKEISTFSGRTRPWRAFQKERKIAPIDDDDARFEIRFSEKRDSTAAVDDEP